MADPSVLLSKSLALRMRDATEIVEGLPADQIGVIRPRQSIIPFQFRRFELRDELSLGSQAAAHPLVYSGSSLQVVTDGDRVFTVTDPLSMFRGRARDEENDIIGSRGWAIKRHDKADWEIIQIQPFVTMFRGLADGDITGSGTASVYAPALIRCQPAGADWIVGATGSDPEAIDVANPMSFDVDADAVLVCAWDELADGYYILQAECPA